MEWFFFGKVAGFWRGLFERIGSFVLGVFRGLCVDFETTFFPEKLSGCFHHYSSLLWYFSIFP